MMQKRWLGRFLVLFLNVTVTVVIALSNVAVQRAFAAPKTDPANTVTKGWPVAVVYYRCVLNKAGHCTPWDGWYFVHNGKAAANFPNPTEDRVLILHAPDWSTVDLLHICGATQAAKYVNIPPGPKNPCHGDRITKEIAKQLGIKPDLVWRPWVWQVIHQYGKEGTAITYMVDGKVHNGAFVSFKPAKGKLITNLPAKGINQTGVLQLQHVAAGMGSGTRIAKSATAFTVRTVPVPTSQKPTKIQVKRL